MVVFIGRPPAKLIATVALPTNNAFSPVNDGGGQAGDLMVICAFAVTGAGAARNVPSGWNELFIGLTTITGSPGVGINVLYRILDGTETGDITLWTGTIVDSDGIVQRFRWTGTPTHADVAAEAGAGNPASQTVNASGTTPPVLVIGVATAFEATVDPLSFSPTEGYDSGALAIDDAVSTFRVKHLLYPEGSTPANVAVDMDDEGLGQVLGSGYLVNV